jgi:hypothetical protein
VASNAVPFTKAVTFVPYEAKINRAVEMNRTDNTQRAALTGRPPGGWP